MRLFLRVGNIGWMRIAATAAVAVVLALAVSTAMAEDAMRVTFDNGGAFVASAGVAVRVEGEEERESFRIAAVVNDELRRAGIRPDSTAPAQLYLRFARPRVLWTRDRPDIAVIGRGGSSSHTRFGVEIQVPMDGRSPPPPPMAHRLTARLERGAGDVVWEAEAETDAVPGTGEQAALRRLGKAVAAALGNAASRRP